MSGFQSPNYTQTPNDLFDQLLPDLGLAELKVVLCIVRHTFGYHKDNVKLSVRAIARFTGLTAKSVMEGAKQAEEHGLIERRMDGNKTTLWSAIVSVVPTTTRRNTKYNARVLPSETLLGVKERKKDKEDTHLEMLSIENQIYAGVKQVIIPNETELLRRNASNLIATGFGINSKAAFALAMMFQNERDFTFTESDIKKQRTAIKAMLEKNVKPEHIQQAVKALGKKQYTMTGLHSVLNTAVDIATRKIDAVVESASRTFATLERDL
jgi:phage replication O-like protein O